MIHDTAVRQAALPVQRYGALLRDMVGSRRKAPVISHFEPLIDVLVHGQDIALPLGRERPMPVRPTAAAATRVWGMGWPFRARHRLAGLQLVATDCTWSAGQGARVEGDIRAILLLLLAGRGAAALPRLSGAGHADLRTRLTPATRS